MADDGADRLSAPLLGRSDAGAADDAAELRVLSVSASGASDDAEEAPTPRAAGVGADVAPPDGDDDDDDEAAVYARLAAVLSLLLAGYLVTRAVARAGLPSDAARDAGYVCLLGEGRGGGRV